MATLAPRSDKPWGWVPHSGAVLLCGVSTFCVCQRSMCVCVVCGVYTLCVCTFCACTSCLCVHVLRVCTLCVYVRCVPSVCVSPLCVCTFSPLGFLRSLWFHPMVKQTNRLCNVTGIGQNNPIAEKSLADYSIGIIHTAFLLQTQLTLKYIFALLISKTPRRHRGVQQNHVWLNTHG